MRILPIQFYNSRICADKNNNIRSSKSNSVSVPPDKTPKVDTISFTAMDPRVGALKSLLYYKIPDLYSDVILLPRETLQAIVDRQIFSSKLKDVLRLVKPYQTSLFPIDKQFFEMMRKEAQKSPNIKLDSYVRSLVPQYHTQLLKTQQDVFDTLSSYAGAFPADLLEKFNYLLYITNQKLNNKHIFIPFSVKEFKHKLGKIAERIGCSDNSEESLAMKKLISIANTLPVIPKEVRMEPKFKMKKYEDKQKIMIAKFRNFFEHSVLKNDRDLRRVIEVAEYRIYKKPAVIPFNRKSFIYDVQKITDRLEDKQLAHLVEKEAVSLPTSMEDLSAFVVKEAERSSEQIVYDMLSGAIGSIDHLLASHKGGKDSLYNYALSSSYENAKKAHSSFAKFMKRDPQMPRYIQHHIDRLIYLANSGVFELVGLEKFYIPSLVKRLESMASPKTPLNINTNKLLY